MINLRELQHYVDTASKESAQTENDWFGVLLVPPVSHMNHGGLYWATNYSFSCAATLDGVDRLTDVVAQFDRAKNLNNLGYLATRPMFGALESPLDARSKSFTFLRESVDSNAESVLSTHYLIDLASVLPLHGGDEQLRETVLERIRASTSEAAIYMEQS